MGTSRRIEDYPGCTARLLSTFLSYRFSPIVSLRSLRCCFYNKAWGPQAIEDLTGYLGLPQLNHYTINIMRGVRDKPHNMSHERRSRGDLIEVYKASQGLSQLSGVLNFSRSGLNILCKQGKCKDSKINRVRRIFLNDRVTLIWNKLPTEVKISSSLNVFKSNLELFKCKTKALGICGTGNFWEISDEV